MILAEDLLLLLLDDDTGELAGAKHLDTALGVAMLADLALLGSVSVASGDPSRKQQLTAVGAPPGHPLLVESLDLVAKKQRSIESLVDRLAPGLRKRVIQGLTDRGILDRRTEHTLGFIPRTRWPAADSAHEAQVRETLAATLATGQPPDSRTRSLGGLLWALGIVDEVVGVRDLSARQVRHQADVVASGDWAGTVLRDLISAARTSRVLDVAGEIASGLTP